MNRLKRILLGLVLSGIGAIVALTVWIAAPGDGSQRLSAPLREATPESWDTSAFAADAAKLSRTFESQEFRSFCGPASLATVLRAYGAHGANQHNVFPSMNSQLQAFYGGMRLIELEQLAESAGLQVQAIYADRTTFEQFRETLKNNVADDRNFVLVNYDRKVLSQEGAGHISPVGAYDEATDSFMVLDQAAYKYPFTWIPADLLFKATRTLDADHYRGLLIIEGYDAAALQARY